MPDHTFLKETVERFPVFSGKQTKVTDISPLQIPIGGNACEKRIKRAFCLYCSWRSRRSDVPLQSPGLRVAHWMCQVVPCLQTGFGPQSSLGRTVARAPGSLLTCAWTHQKWVMATFAGLVESRCSHNINGVKEWGVFCRSLVTMGLMVVNCGELNIAQIGEEWCKFWGFKQHCAIIPSSDFSEARISFLIIRGYPLTRVNVSHWNVTTWNIFGSPDLHAVFREENLSEWREEVVMQ